ncbi:putative cystathionine gamma-synthase [Phytophthora infestans]|uniref:Putative cystathionine gamma-synthase n=1 Tax=Phytophthora infestans TaxID=4787 RepID=A0A833SEM1_PHYIN|nr:putative cystathionine gamma-synthase [Phytophthora infestans]KAF4146288.1 putative cystathionine gamma-synthase [Phytophthora infestans]
MPDWEHVMGYEEGRAEVLDAMACGYPRFFRHPFFARVMTVPTSDAGERPRHFLLASNSDSVKSERGEIVSSRHAEKLLQVLKSDGDVQSPAIRGTDSHLALRQRVSELYLPFADAKKVALYPTGMGAIFSTVRLLQMLRGTEYKSILVGFPYVDTLKILSWKEWCP